MAKPFDEKQGDPGAAVSGWFAGLMSLILPGLGCLHQGRFRQAALAYLGGVGILLLGLFVTFGTGPGLFLTLAFLGLWTLGWAWQAARLARTPQAGGRPWFTRKPAVLSLAVLSMLFTTCGLPRTALRHARFRFGEGTSTSMEPVLHGGDLFVWDAHAFRGKGPGRMDLICFQAPEGEPAQWVKRCVALAGDRVEIREGELYVNGARQGRGPGASPLATHAKDAPEAPLEYLGPLVVPEGTVFCLGDNGVTSYDSRYWGPLPQQAILGRILFAYGGKGWLSWTPLTAPERAGAVLPHQ